MAQEQRQQTPAHFKGKEAIEHVVEAQVKGVVESAEIHGTEIPGHFFAGADAARETAVSLVLLAVLVYPLALSLDLTLALFVVFCLGWLFWKAGRSAWLGWSRLERIHRVVEQEKWEIQHHRPQEREELKELYRAKGFEGQLLEDVIDVLMADEDRLLRVMVEEELCLTLGSHEHPLKQAVGAMVGVLAAAICCLLPFAFFSYAGLIFGCFATVGLSAALSACREGNRIISAVMWNLGLAAMSSGCAYFLQQYLSSDG